MNVIMRHDTPDDSDDGGAGGGAVGHGHADPVALSAAAQGQGHVLAGQVRLALLHQNFGQPAVVE